MKNFLVTFIGLIALSGLIAGCGDLSTAAPSTTTTSATSTTSITIPSTTSITIPSTTTSTTIAPTGYIVAGAGYSGVNGTYTVSGMVNGKTSYTYSGFTLFYYNDAGGDGEIWLIANTTTMTGRVPYQYYYFVTSSANFPPSTGWQVDHDGTASAPTLTAQ